MSDESALLAAIRLHPGDDAPRLVYADWLDENAASVACGKCFEFGGRWVIDNPHKRRGSSAIIICPTCSGTGQVADGRRERAEFIRVQCELARPFAAQCRACGKPLEGDRVADGCPCNSPRGVNHGIVPAYVCTCCECDPEQTGSVRARPADVEGLLQRERARLIAFPAAPYWSIPDSLTDSHPHRDVPPAEPGIRCHGLGVREVRFDFRRGFAERVTCEAVDWLANADAILAAHPVRRVTLTTRPEVEVVMDFCCRLRGRERHFTRERLDVAHLPPGQVMIRNRTPEWLLAAEWPGITFDLSGAR